MPTPIETIQQFCLLFDGSREAVGTEEGGCERIEPEDWSLYVKGHVTGANPPIGVYPMTTMIDDDETTLGATYGPYRWVVKWGCVDFDEGDEVSWAHALNLYSVLKVMGVSSYIERSRSKGYHVWVFLEDWTDADTVRRALLAACQIAGAPTKEINPKQVELKPGKLGNYVRLPYPNAINDPVEIAWDGKGHRRVIVDTAGVPLPLHEFVTRVELVSEDALENVADFYIPPAAKHRTIGRLWDSVLEGDAVERLRGKARIIFEQGPLEMEGSPTNFRGQTLWKLARYLREDGKHTPEEALMLVRDADSRWGKFYERADGDQRLVELVEKAFSA